MSILAFCKRFDISADRSSSPRRKDRDLPTPEDIAQDQELIASADDGDGDAAALVALALLRTGDHEAARGRFESCRAQLHPLGLHGVAALTEASDPDGSWELMQKALGAGATQALVRLARIARLRGADEFSEDLLLRAAQLGDADAMYEVAHLATDAGDHDTSRRWYATAVEREAGMEWPIQRGVGFFLL